MFDEVGEYMNTQRKNALLFRKKLVTVEAFQMTLGRMQSNLDWPHWLHEAWNREVGHSGRFFSHDIDGQLIRFMIHTLEGYHVVSIDDWIVKNIAGELYTYKPEIFEELYEKA